MKVQRHRLFGMVPLPNGGGWGFPSDSGLAVENPTPKGGQLAVERPSGETISREGGQLAGEDEGNVFFEHLLSSGQPFHPTNKDDGM